MFKRSFAAAHDRSGKVRKVSKRSFLDDAKQRMREEIAARSPDTTPTVGGASPSLNTSVVQVIVGPDQRMFGGHEEMLSKSPILAEKCGEQFFESPGQKRIRLPDEEPWVFAAVLEFLYKGDYTPRLMHSRKRRSWYLEGDEDPTNMSISMDKSKTFVGRSDDAAIFHSGVGDCIFRDTAVYCAAARLALPDLQRLAFRKQSMVKGPDVAVILRSARFAYAHLPASDYRLRAYYIHLVARNGRRFRGSRTMQKEMEKGGTQLFFDVFCTMTEHMSELEEKW